ncbi:DUF2834 domain-containing protein [Microcoleus sp. ARI1-B5]|uniref:DUF2834 domain-containing protein n=1 Tax=unclassified Microcoleus TaxID=2642155 RepID=UPI002FCF217F
MLKSLDASKTNTPVKLLYLLIAIAPAIAPWFFLLQYPTALLSPSLFLQRAFENNIAAARTTDLLISVVAFFCFVGMEQKRLKVSQLWLLLYVGLTFAIGLSCALPFFLYRREQILERNTFRQLT